MSIISTILAAIIDRAKGPMSEAEAERVVKEAAEAHEEDLNPLDWVDTLKAMNQPSDKASRKALWIELDGEGEYTGSAAQNVESRKRFMNEVAKRTIKAPKKE